MSTGIFTVVFGAVFVLVGVRFILGERRAAARGQRRVRGGYLAACALVIVFGLVALALAVPLLAEGFSGDAGF